MANAKKVAIATVVVVAAVGVIMLRRSKTQAVEKTPDETAVAEVSTNTPDEPSSRQAKEQALPRLIDLGAHSCIPCKMMAPILDELKKEYAGVFKTEFIDVWQNQDAGNQYGIQSIPTQMFFDADGKEIFRHVGFFAKEDILATWNKHGVVVDQK